MSEKVFNPDKYPGIEFAYEFVQPSFDCMVGRLDAARNGLQRIQAFAATLIFAFPAIAVAAKPNISFQSFWLYAAIAVFVSVIVVGVMAGAFVGPMQLIHPGILYKKWLRLSEPEFKKNVIFFAGEAFNHNSKQVNNMGNAARILNYLVGAEVLLLVAWLLITC